MKVTPVKIWRRQKSVTSLIGVEGEILLWTIIRVPEKSFVNEAPYPVVIVKISNNKKMIGQLVDWEKIDLESGRKVVAVLRKTTPENSESVIPYAIKFKPL